MIDFETPKPIVQINNVVETVAVNMMRPVSRYFDEHEHEIPWDYIIFMHQAVKSMGGTSMAPEESLKKEEDPNKPKRPPIAYQRLAHMVEMLAWGDTGMYLCIPGGLLGSAAVAAAGTPEQKKRFLSRLVGDKPTFDAMAMTEPQAGSDTSAIRTSAVLDSETNEWVLNGEKIFVTAGHKALVDSEGFVVVWASVDPTAGRRGMRAFVVEAGTPGCTVTKMEHKLGIRASDTVSLLLQDCRIPFDNLLGSPAVETSTKGFKGAMATFDATRPIVAAQAIGIARATLELLKEELSKNGIEIRYGLPRQKLTNIEREVIDMEVMLRSAWLLIIKALWMADNKLNNPAEASMAKVRGGDIVVKITQKAVEILGPLGYSRELLIEKWFRDAKITDLYEGTGQINRLVVARNILGYRGSELR
ncbi:MAG TPA: acyl-CoA dehydrogenase [Chloroflexi bacterium]|nr:acyl-CoA dehydrogenase [Chloroflexota bacterium]HBY06497.1 acyl-CoA dehydrogenase [Chloroflexota bacterium]